MIRDEQNTTSWHKRPVVAALVLLLILSLLPPATHAAPATATASLPCPLDPAPLCLKLVVSEDALYRVSAADLTQAGWNLATLDPSTLGLTSQGQAVAIRVAGETDGVFDQADYVEFYGQRFRGDQMEEKYTDDNVYWLSAGGQPGPRMVEASAAPQGAAYAPDTFWTTLRAEEDNLWYTHWVLDWPTRDTWWWARVWTTTQAKADLPTYVPAPATEPYTATLTIEVAPRQKEYRPHHFQVTWNDPTTEPPSDPVMDVTFQNHELHQAQAELPGSALVEGTNTLSLWLFNEQSAQRVPLAPGTIIGLDDDLAPVFAPTGTTAYPSDELYINYYELQYRRRYRAHEDQLWFTADVTGQRTVRIDGFSDVDLLLYDVSNPLQPVQYTQYQIGFAADATRLLTAQLSLGLDKTYLALSEAQAKTPKQITPPLLSTLRSEANGADYLVISHGDFLASAQRLADFRASHDGFRTRVVDVAEVYEQFNHGIFHPEAIRQLIAFAVANWQEPAPQYVLLVGDGHWNFKANGVSTYGQPDPNWIPPYLVWEDPWQGEVPSDQAFVALNPDSPLANIAIGRLPARSVAEADLMVDKIIAYETNRPQYTPSWQQHALFVADNPDSAGNFPYVSDQIIEDHMPRHIQPWRAYLGITHIGSQAVKQAIEQSLEAGVLMLTYLGHGSINRWADEQVWTTADVGSLDNAQTLPIVVTLNCLDGYFAHGDSSRQSMAEEMLRHGNGGSVAAWSPAGLGTTTYERMLHGHLLDTIFLDGVRRLGPATMEAKAKYYNSLGSSPSPYQTSLIHTMTVYGDPALTLPTGTWRQHLPALGRNADS